MPTVDDTQPIARAPRTAARVAVVLLVLLLGSLGLAVEEALSAPGNDPVTAKLAEWGRDNGLGGINPGWVSGAYFHDHPVGAPTGFALFPAEQVPPTRYLSPSSRDWYSWELR